MFGAINFLTQLKKVSKLGILYWRLLFLSHHEYTVNGVS
jgi:hypothetical protein